MLKAFSVLETDEHTGGIVFAKSNIEARRVGAARYGGGEISGWRVERMKGLDKFAETGVPASLLVWDGWHFECWGCGMRICDDTLTDSGRSPDDVVGKESGRVFCCHACRIQSLAETAAREAFGAAFLDMMEDRISKRFPGADISFDGGGRHVYIPRDDPPYVIAEAHVAFKFPGMKIGPARLEYRHEGRFGARLIGPVRLEFRCCAGDVEAFEAFAVAYPKPKRREAV